MGKQTDYCISLEDKILLEIEGIKDLLKDSGITIKCGDEKNRKSKKNPLDKIEIYNAPEGFLEERLGKLIGESKTPDENGKMIYGYTLDSIDLTYDGTIKKIRFKGTYTLTGIKKSELSDLASNKTAEHLNLLSFKEQEEDGCPIITIERLKNEREYNLALYKFLRYAGNDLKGMMGTKNTPNQIMMPPYHFL